MKCGVVHAKHYKDVMQENVRSTVVDSNGVMWCSKVSSTGVLKCTVKTHGQRIQHVIYVWDVYKLYPKLEM